MNLSEYAGHKIKALRLERNLTQDDLAKAVGVGKSAIANYEAGYRSPKQDTLFLLSEFFEVSINAFFPPTKSEEDNKDKTVNHSTDISLSDKQMKIINQIIEELPSERELQQAEMFISLFFSLSEQGKELAIDNLMSLAKVFGKTSLDENKEVI